MQKDYDRYYEILRLQPGAGLSEIESSWKYWAPLFHPDNYAPGALQDRANNELKELNDARDQLRNWWTTNGGAPPSKMSSTAPPGQPQEPPPAPQPKQQKAPGTDKKTWQEQAYDNWKEERTTGGTPPPPRDETPRPKFPTKPFGPPRFTKSWNHHVYDVMESSRDDAAVLSFLFWAAFGIGPFIVGAIALSMVTAMFNIEPGPVPATLAFVATLAAAVPFWRIVKADMDIYKIEVTPYLQSCLLPSAHAMNKITDLVEGKTFPEKKWELATTDLVAEDNILSRNWVMSFQEGDRKYRILLNTRVMRNDQDYHCMVSYWFDIDPATGSRIPAAHVVKATDEALWKGLKQ